MLARSLLCLAWGRDEGASVAADLAEVYERRRGGRRRGRRRGREADREASRRSGFSTREGGRPATDAQTIPSRASAWLWAWWQVLAAVAHGVLSARWRRTAAHSTGADGDDGQGRRGAPDRARETGGEAPGPARLAGGAGPGRWRSPGPARVTGWSRPDRGPHVRPLLALRLALRGLLRDRATSAVAVLVLTLGLAAPATFFSILRGGMRPLPVPEGHRVVQVRVEDPVRGGALVSPTSADLVRWEGVAGLERVGGLAPFGATLGSRTHGATLISAAALTPEALALLRVGPEAGRLPGPDEAGSTVLLGHELWAEAFDADPAVLGGTVTLDGEPRTVTGIMPPTFGFPYRQQAWVVREARPGDGMAWEAVGRLAPGARGEAVAAALEARWRPGEPAAAGTRPTIRVLGFTAERGEGGEAVVFGGLVLIGLCLLAIACSNVANLLLVRATERVRVLGMQVALGAGRAQIALQLLLEALLVAAVGGAAGLLVARELVGHVQRTMGPENFGYHWMRMAVDLPVVAFLGALVLGTALVAGLLPVVRVLRADLQRILRDDGSGAGVGGGGRWSRAFVTAQLALSCGALVAAGLTARAMAAARDFGSALPGDEVLMAQVRLDGGAGTATAERRGLLEDLARAVAAVPGARLGALATGAPGFQEGVWSPLEVDGAAPPATDGSGPARTLATAVTPAFFPLLDLEAVRGRLLDESDGPGAPPAAVVNQSWVRRFAGGREPLGRAVRVPGLDSATTWTVVGVVEDAALTGGPVAREDRVYVPLSRAVPADVTVLVRGPEAEALAAPLRRAVAAVDPDLPVSGVRSLRDAHRFMTRAQSTFALLAVSGGSAGLLVATVGLYGLLAFRVRRRRRELGVRLALGADGARLAREVVEAALRQLVPALALGLAAAWLVAPVLGLILLGGDPRSPGVYGAVGGAFLLTGLGAALVPALRASATDPARVLRAE